MLWSEKYKPTEFSFSHHPFLTKTLKSYSLSTIPHLLLYGPSGHSKKTLVTSLIAHLYNTTPHLVLKTTTIKTSKTIEISYLESQEYIEITPSDYLYQDKNVIQTLIKELAQTKPILGLIKKEKSMLKVIVINEADKMTRDAQAALRRTVEKYSTNFRIILVCEEMNGIIEPLRSRMLCLRVNGFSDEEISNEITRITKTEDKTINEKIVGDILEKSNGNMRRAMCLAELMSEIRESNKRIKREDALIILEYERIIDGIVKSIMHMQDGETILKIRKDLYELLNGCIPAVVILKEMMNKLIIKNKEEIGKKITDYALLYEERMKLGTKDIIHLEGFVVAAMGLFYK